MKFRWLLETSQPERARHLSQSLGISCLLAQCLLNRGLNEEESARRFLNPRLRDLSDPFLIPHMRTAVDRLCSARSRRESVVVFGDYDVDGITSTALLVEGLEALGWTVHCYLPARFGEGYGLTQEAVENCLVHFPATLLVAVDCGSTSATTIRWLRNRGTDVIVLDHHQISDPPPPAVALVNPLCRVERLAGVAPTDVPFSELSAAGLAFKLVHALVKRGREEQWPSAQDFDVRPLLDLAALGTVADVVPLVRENRILVTAGLEHLNHWVRPGLKALRNVAAIEGRAGCYEIGFQLAPRLNAAGRLEHAAEALALLRAHEPGLALQLAQGLDAKNSERQSIQREMTDEAIAAVRERFCPETDWVIVEGKESWHIGVVGIVAARVLREFYRPTLILGGDGGEWRGSGRSIQGFDMAAALSACGDLLLRHGGHAMAAGISMRAQNIAPFRERLNEYARQTLRAEQLSPPLRLDANVFSGEITLGKVEELQRLQPTGTGNPAVQLAMLGVAHQRNPQRMGNQQQHAKFWVGHQEGYAIEAVWWNCGDQPLPKVRFDLAVVPEINTFNGNRTVQLKILDWRPAAPPSAAAS